MDYKIFRNNLGKVTAVNDPFGSSLIFDPGTKTFDETDSLTIALRQWEAENGKLDLSDRPIEPLSLDGAKVQKKQEIVEIAIAKQEELVAGFAPPEQASWGRKVAEAKAFLASEKIEDAPMLRAEAIAISGAKTESIVLKYTQGLASKILAKSEAMYLDSAQIAGTRTRLLSQVEYCKTIQELNAIAWN